MHTCCKLDNNGICWRSKLEDEQDALVKDYLAFTQSKNGDGYRVNEWLEQAEQRACRNEISSVRTINILVGLSCFSIAAFPCLESYS